MARRGWQDAYLRLHPRVALKNLEQPYLYHIDNDELYELNDDGEISCWPVTAPQEGAISPVTKVSSGSA